MLIMVSISTSAAALGSNKIEGRVIGLLGTSVSAFTKDFRACSCEAMEVAAIVASPYRSSSILSVFVILYPCMSEGLTGTMSMRPRNKGFRSGTED